MSLESELVDRLRPLARDKEWPEKTLDRLIAERDSWWGEKPETCERVAAESRPSARHQLERLIIAWEGQADELRALLGALPAKLPDDADQALCRLLNP